MSIVTNVILTYQPPEAGVDESGCVDELNRLIERAGIRGILKKVDKFAGGTKSMEVDVYLAAFNCLDESALVSAVTSVDWEQPDSVQMFLLRQEERRFVEVPLRLSKGPK